ncbi:uncharacterized protein LJ206_010275 [Theristicus caerulescens]
MSFLKKKKKVNVTSLLKQQPEPKLTTHAQGQAANRSLGGPEADSSCPAAGGHRPAPPTRRNGGEAPPKLVARALRPTPGGRRPRPARRPRRQVRGPSPAAAAPSRHPAPTWRGRWRKVSPGKGEAGSAPSLPKRPAPGGREAATQMIPRRMSVVPSQQKMPVLPGERFESSFLEKDCLMESSVTHAIQVILTRMNGKKHADISIFLQLNSSEYSHSKKSNMCNHE